MHGLTIPQIMFYFTLYGGATVMALLLCLYLLLSKVNIIAPGVTPPARLRRWAAAFFGFVAVGHVYWLLAYAGGFDEQSLIFALLAVLDCVGMPITLFGTMLSMLQDRRRPLRPFVAAIVPVVLLGALQAIRPDINYAPPTVVYVLVLYAVFTVYMIIAVRQYQRWLRDHYADLEHKEVWVSHTLVLVVLLLLVNYGFANGMLAFVIVQLSNYAIFALLVWRVETLPTLDEAEEEETHPQQTHPQPLPSREGSGYSQDENAVDELSTPLPVRAGSGYSQDENAVEELSAPLPHREGLGGGSAGRGSVRPEVLSRIGQLLEKECVGTRLYLKQDLTLSQLSAAIGVNRNYIGQYFASQDTTYYSYIHDLRINHFMRLCREAVAARRPFKAQQLALDSGFRSYSTFATAFKQRTGQSVASWVSDLESHYSD